MSRGKLKQKKLKKKYLLFCFLAILFISLILLLSFSIFKIFNFQSFYKKESRVTNISENKKEDNENKKTVGWIRVQGTNIDYPVIYAPGYDFSYETSDFAWTEVDFKNLNNVIFISGHNIKNQSTNPSITSPYHNRFEQLMSFTYSKFVEDNKYIQYTFNGDDYIYKIFSVSYVDNLNLDIYNDSEYSKDEMNSFIKNLKNVSLYDFDVDVNNDDKIITLVTCTKMFKDSSRDFIVSGRLMRNDEKIENYNFKTTSNYNYIYNIMKGGDSDEEV